MTVETLDDDVRTSVRGGIGRINLDRPRAMNALTHPMVVRVDGALDEWRGDPDVQAVLIDGAGERGLCAGGDIKMFHASALGDGRAAIDFWTAEYRMNAQLAAYPKPVVALMSGAVLGGGVGISAHCRHRVVTETTSIGMPEVGIGFVPDVGGTWLLGRAPGELGLYLALTGQPVGPGDALLCGLADTFVRSSELLALRAAPDAMTLLDAVEKPVGDRPAAPLADQRHWIDECFAAPSAGEIVRALRGHPGVEAKAAADLIETRSPEAVQLTLLAVRHARTLPSLPAALAAELAVSVASLARPDFVEGIRAQVIDKDRTPRWTPSSLDDVDVAQLTDRFAAWVAAADERQFQR
ncbi:MAG: enoyl-CoA hydratase [Pseudonocardiales bacterium]|nr:enoyl-CoA hydratase [Pseudonocardiales bacterium]